MSTTTENNYVSNGSTVLYPFTFPYINEADVKVSLNQLDTTAFTLANATTVELDVAPVSGVSIRIYRSTPTDAIAAEFFPGSAIRAQDLNANFEQSLYVVQENQTIIENSDAASVVGIANQALATANQAKNTADSVSGTANQALTEAGEADTTANQALSDAATAQATAVAARTVADAALNSGSVLSDLSDVSSTPAITNQVLGWSGSTWGPVNQTGGGGGGATINYNGASAWGYVAANGTLQGGLNINVTNTAAGTYECDFITPVGSSNYSVTTSSGNTGNIVVVFDQTSTGFKVYTVSKDSGAGGLTNSEFSFSLFATNSLPPQGTTGTDSFGAVEKTTVNGPCVVSASYNVASVTRISQGYYQVTFTTAMPTADYSVTTAPDVDTPTSTAAVYAQITVSERTASGFRVLSRYQNRTDGSASDLDSGFNFSVNATNANLPLSFTSEQIKSAINNPGASAWGNSDSNGTFLEGLNTASVTKTSTGLYDVVFTTPMPNTNYSVVVSSGVNQTRFLAQTATGFTIETRNSNGALVDTNTTFAVFATNSLPHKGGTGTDAFGSVSATGVLEQGYNVTTSSLGTGQYYVAFNTPMPTATYAVNATASYLPNSVLCTCQVNSKTVNGFSVIINNASTGVSQNNNFNFTVNATNATLPSTFTEAQIQAVVDLAQNPQGIAKAWGYVNSTLQKGYNINSTISNPQTGVYDVTFLTPMSDGDYVVNATAGLEIVGNACNCSVGSKTVNGFQININKVLDNQATNQSFNFTVFSD